MKFCLLALGVLSFLHSTAQAEIAKEEQLCRPLEVGANVPDVKIRNIKGDSLTLTAIRNSQPTVIVFFRGTWCPLCTRALAYLQQAESELTKMGFQIVAISSESPKNLAKFAPAIDPEWVRPFQVKGETGRQRFVRLNLPKKALSYKLYCDPEANAAEAFGVAFHEKVVGTDYDRLKKIPLIPTRNGKAWLPLPSVFIVDKSGKIRFVDLNRTADGTISKSYQRRIRAKELIDAASKVLATDGEK